MRELEEQQRDRTKGWKSIWKSFEQKHPGIAQFLIFFMVCNGVTVLQMIIMPVLKGAFAFTPLVDVDFRILQVGTNPNGSPYYIFDYAAGLLQDGGGGGLAYFLAVELTMAIAQIINFITQRKVTFKSTGKVWRAAFWYVLAYVVITVGAAALQGLYKTPLYRWAIQTMGSAAGTVAADVLTMIINCMISFWVFYPIMKWIFKREEGKNAKTNFDSD